MKKILSLALCALMLTALSLTAFAQTADDTAVELSNAVDFAESYSTCNHTYITLDAYVAQDQFVYVDNTGCAHPVVNRMKCTKCGDIYVSSATGAYVDKAPHSGSPYRATCTGTMQTWYCTCNNCHHNFTKQVACQGKDHRNGCKWLPV